MNCRSFRKTLISKTSGELAETAELAEFNQHPDSCPACRLFRARYEAVDQRLGEGAAEERDRRPRPGFAAGVMAALPERPNPLAWATLRLLPATSALALALLGWCWLETPTPNELWTQAAEDELLTWVMGGNSEGD